MIKKFVYMKMQSKISSAKLRPLCPGEHELTPLLHIDCIECVTSCVLNSNRSGLSGFIIVAGISAGFSLSVCKQTAPQTYVYVYI